MARIRTIKIGFFESERLAEFSPWHRLLFEGLWLIADKEGRLEDRPKRIHAKLFPYDKDLDIAGMLRDLASGDDPFLVRYVVDGKPLIQVCNFLKHQRPHHTEPASTYPPVNTALASAPDKVRETTVNSPLDNGEAPLGREGKGREGVKEGKGAGSALPVKWSPPVKPIVDGSSNRRHGQHAACFIERGLCVTSWVHEELVGKYGGDKETAETTVRQWYQDRVSAIPAHERIANPKVDNWWRDEFAKFLGFTGNRAPTKAEQSIAAGLRVIQRMGGQS